MCVCVCVSGGGLFEPVQVVCVEGGKAHVVVAGPPVAWGTGRAGDAYFVRGFADPVPPGRQKNGRP